MRTTRCLAGGLVLLAALVTATEPSSAQTLLQRLFGLWGRAPDYGHMGEPMGPGVGPGADPSDDGSRYYDDGQSFPEDPNTYRTLCVRTCDGFYFPISDGVRRARLYSDARTCTQRCDGEARLFYYPTNGGSVETMVDLSGRRYASLPTAFLYRKNLVAGCACKPEPWSPQEAARHQGYAAAQAAAGGGQADEAHGATAAAQGEGPYDEDQAEADSAPPPRPAYYSRWRQRERYGWR
jgi:Protein of unknown function (DUF2865)